LAMPRQIRKELGAAVADLVCFKSSQRQQVDRPPNGASEPVSEPGPVFRAQITG